MTDFLSCSICGTRIRLDRESSWRGDNGAVVVVSDSVAPYALVTTINGDAYVCESCYISNRFSVYDSLTQCQVHYEFALAFMECRQFIKARAALLCANGIAPSADVDACLGLVAEHLNEPAEAVRLYRRALSIDSRHVMAAANLGRVLSAMRSQRNDAGDGH